MKVKKYAKADIGSYSRIFFQIGLILVLASTYAGLEWEFTERDNSFDYDIGVFEEDEIDIPISQLNTPPPPPPPPPVMPEIVQVVEDDLEVEEDIIESTESSQDSKTIIIPVSDVIVAEDEEEIAEVPFFVVEQIPLYPGCENIKVKAEQKKCMENKIHSLFSKEFNTGISEQMGLNGIYRIFVVFKISATGEVVEIKTRGPNTKLELEAERVAKLLPKMTPGKQRGKPVAVSYSLPVVFTVLPQS